MKQSGSLKFRAPSQSRRQAIRWGGGALAVIAAAGVGLGIGVWEGFAVSGVAIALAGLDQFVNRRRGLRDQRYLAQLSREERNCKSCGSDLWGLDVKPGTAGRYRVKCSECGVINEIKPIKRKRVRQQVPDQGEVDTPSFKIRG